MVNSEISIEHLFIHLPADPAIYAGPSISDFALDIETGGMVERILNGNRRNPNQTAFCEKLSNVVITTLRLLHILSVSKRYFSIR